MDRIETPLVPERALFLDVGRKYYTPDWLRAMIRLLGENRMNALILHFSEEMGLGLESRLYPWLGGRDGQLCVPAERETDERQITQDELKELARYAAECGVSLIPSFDSPGHMNYIVEKFAERARESAFSFTFGGKTYEVPQGKTIANAYHCAGRTAVVQGSRNTRYSRGIDVSDELAAAFAKSLLCEYAALFRECGCRAIDIGGDELLGWGASIDSSIPKWRQLDHWKAYAADRAAKEGRDPSDMTAYDGFVYYMNDLYRLMRGMGYSSVRMWNDEAFRSSDTGWTADPEKHILPDPGLEIEYWTENADHLPAEFLRMGRTVYNMINVYSYYVLGKAVPYGHCNVHDITESWTPFRFASETVEPSDRLAGCAFCIWSDDPAEPEETVWERVVPLIRTYAAKAWGK